jgi:hypothetical protein
LFWVWVWIWDWVHTPPRTLLHTVHVLQCPPSPLAHSFTIGPAVINTTQQTACIMCIVGARATHAHLALSLRAFRLPRYTGKTLLQSPHEEGSTGDDPRMGYLLITNSSSFLLHTIRYRGGEPPLARCRNRRDHAQRYGGHLVWRRVRCGGLGLSSAKKQSKFSYYFLYEHEPIWYEIVPIFVKTCVSYHMFYFIPCLVLVHTKTFHSIPRVLCHTMSISFILYDIFHTMSISFILYDIFHTMSISFIPNDIFHTMNDMFHTIASNLKLNFFGMKC